MNRRTPKALQILASTVGSLFLALYAAGQSAGTFDFWSLIRIGDQAVGYFRETARPSVDGRTVTAIDSVVALNHLGDKVEIIQKAEIEESADGSLLKTDRRSKAAFLPRAAAAAPAPATRRL